MSQVPSLSTPGEEPVDSRVAAVIVSYNSGAMLGRVVDALLSGSVSPDVYIVDNASGDDSAEVIREKMQRYGAVHGRFNDRNIGFAAANNQALGEVEADYFLLVNPDCVVERDTIQAFVECLEADPAVGMAGGALSNPDGSPQKTSKRRFPTPWNSLARTLGLHRLGLAGGAWSDFDLAESAEDGAAPEEVEAISGAMMFVRGTALARVGGLDAGYFMHCEDLDWCKRFHDCGYKVVHVPGAKAMHAKGGSGRGARVVWHLHRGMARFHRKHYAGRYPFWFNGLVYAGIGLRCTLLMAAALVGKPGKGRA